ncbi:MAG: hypothetical protein ACRCSV_04790 [Chlamydiales bacterium]
MIPSFNTTLPSPSSNQIQPPFITMQELHSILKTWARNPSTNASRSDATEIAKKILIFHKIETDSKYRNQRNQSLEITGVQARSFPDIFSYPPFNRIINLNLQMGLSKLPTSMFHLKGLRSLNLSNNHLDHLPENVSELSQLVDLNVSHNQLNQIPENLYQLGYLQNLDMSFNLINEIPNNLDRLQYLTNLNLSSNNLSKLPESFSQLLQIKKFNLRENSLISFPDISLSHDDITEDSNVTLEDRIEITNNFSSAERVRKRKAEKFIRQSEIARKVLKNNPPVLITDDLGSSFEIFGEIKDKPIGVYKPRLQSDKEALPGVPAGTEAFRERLAYALNYELSQLFTENNIPLVDFGVPPTRIMNFKHKLFGKHNKTGSLQKYKKNCINFHNTSARTRISETNKNELFKTAILDLIFLNKDRHDGNLLYSQEKNKLNLIDHGACFPEIAGLQEFQFGWKELPFIHEALPKNWVDFILSINVDTLVNRTIKEIAIHTKEFPKEEMQISGESLFVMIFAIKSLQEFVKTNPAPTIGQYLDHILLKNNYHYIEIKNPTDNTTSFIELPEKLPFGYMDMDFDQKDIKRFNEKSFEVMGCSIVPIFSENTPSPGELKLKEMCEKYGFENVILHRKQSSATESQFYEETKEAFKEYTQDKGEINAQFIQENLDEIERCIISYLSKHPIRSLSERLKDGSA